MFADTIWDRDRDREATVSFHGERDKLTGVGHASVVRRVDNAIHLIRFVNSYPLDSDSSSGEHYTPFKQLGPNIACEDIT